MVPYLFQYAQILADREKYADIEYLFSDSRFSDPCDPGIDDQQCKKFQISEGYADCYLYAALHFRCYYGRHADYVLISEIRLPQSYPDISGSTG